MIKLLILDELRKQGITWDHFLSQNGFQEDCINETVGEGESPQGVKLTSAKRRKINSSGSTSGRNKT
jgi:hypothetical protein